MDPTNSNTDISSPPPQPDYFHAVEVDVIHCKAGGVLRIPAIENIMVRYVTPGATQYSRTISSLQEAVAYTNRVRHRVNPAGHDDVIQVRANIVRYRKRIYNAMILLPHGVNEWQEKQWDDFVKAVKNDKFDMKDIEAKSWQLAEEIINLHEQGTTLSAKYDKSLNLMADRNLKCSWRMQKIIDYLLYDKSACLEVMDSNVTMLRFIGAPEAVMSEKQRNRDSYQRLKQKAVGVQATAAASAPTTSQIQSPVTAPAALQPHQASERGNPFHSTSVASMSTQIALDQLARFQAPGNRPEHENRNQLQAEVGSVPGSAHTLAPANTQVDVPTAPGDPTMRDILPHGQPGSVGGHGERDRLATLNNASGTSKYPEHSTAGVAGPSAPIDSPEPAAMSSAPRKRKRLEVEESETDAIEQGDEITED